jgi:hypothetical protein
MLDRGQARSVCGEWRPFDLQRSCCLVVVQFKKDLYQGTPSRRAGSAG